MSKRLGGALLVAFVIVDVILIIGMLRHVNAEPDDAGVASDPAAASDTPSQEAPAQDEYEFDPRQAAVMSVSNDETLMYSRRGQCDGDDGQTAELQVSTNGGASRGASDTGLTEILAVSAVSRSELYVVGADADCVLQTLTSIDGGDSWAITFDEEIWYLDLEEQGEIVSPEGSSEPGCTVTSLSQVGDDFARVSCTDGSIRGTGNGGDDWLELGRLDNLRTASFTSFNAGYALAVYQGCAAQAFTTRDGGRSWAPGGCISGEPAQAISGSDSGLAAVVEGDLYVSGDDGGSWAQP